MEKDNRDAYSEVIGILKLIDDEKLLEALPMEMLEVLKSKANPAYSPNISAQIPLDEQNLQPETLPILSWIAMKYWNVEESNETNFQTEEQHDEKNILDSQQNTEKEENIKQESIEEKVIEDAETIEKNKKSKTEQINTVLPILRKDLKWYQKIKIKIIELFNKLFKINK